MWRSLIDSMRNLPHMSKGTSSAAAAWLGTDGLLERLVRPEAEELVFSYEPGIGRLQTITTPRGDLSFISCFPTKSADTLGKRGCARSLRPGTRASGHETVAHAPHAVDVPGTPGALFEGLA